MFHHEIFEIEKAKLLIRAALKDASNTSDVVFYCRAAMVALENVKVPKFQDHHRNQVPQPDAAVQ